MSMMQTLGPCRISRYLLCSQNPSVSLRSSGQTSHPRTQNRKGNFLASELKLCFFLEGVPQQQGLGTYYVTMIITHLPSSKLTWRSLENHDQFSIHLHSWLGFHCHLSFPGCLPLGWPPTAKNVKILVVTTGKGDLVKGSESLSAQKTWRHSFLESAKPQKIRHYGT